MRCPAILATPLRAWIESQNDWLFWKFKNLPSYFKHVSLTIVHLLSTFGSLSVVERNVARLFWPEVQYPARSPLSNLRPRLVVETIFISSTMFLKYDITTLHGNASEQDLTSKVAFCSLHPLSNLHLWLVVKTITYLVDHFAIKIIRRMQHFARYILSNLRPWLSVETISHLVDLIMILECIIEAGDDYVSFSGFQHSTHSFFLSLFGVGVWVFFCSTVELMMMLLFLSLAALPLSLAVCSVLGFFLSFTLRLSLSLL